MRLYWLSVTCSIVSQFYNLGPLDHNPANWSAAYLASVAWFMDHLSDALSEAVFHSMSFKCYNLAIIVK